MSEKKQSPNTHANRTYYQSVYEQVHASEEFKERLTHMNIISKDQQNKNKNKTKVTRKITWKATAAAAALAVILPTGAYAADHYWGLTDFFRQSGHTLPDEAGKLIETDIAQTLTESGSKTETFGNTEDEKGDEKTEGAKNTDNKEQELPVTFTVQEALCDSGTVHIIIEAKAVESGRYLLVPDHCISEEDSVKDIGIHEDTSIGAYAKAKGLKILYVNSGFSPDSPFTPASCEYTSKSIQDDTLELFLSADREKTDTDLNVILSHTIRSAADDSAEILRAVSTCELKDQSTSRMLTYIPKDSQEVPDTQAVVQRVTMEQTEIYTYVNVYYRDPHAMEEDHGLYFKILDNDGTAWPSKGGRGIMQLEDGSYCLRLSYEKIQLPDSCILSAFDYMEKNTYGQIALVQEDQK